MKKGFFVLFALLVGTQATAATIRCDNCSEATYESKAATSGIGVHYVYDLVKGQTRKYEVALACDENLNDGRSYCVKQSTAMPVEPDVKHAALELAAYYQVTHGTMKSYFTFNADGTVSGLTAYDVVMAGPQRNQLISWFNSTQAGSIQNALPMIGSVAHSVAVTIGSMWNDSMGKTVVKIVFSDGSEITLTFEAINSTVEVAPGTAKDKYGNTIPGSSSELDGIRFDYSGANDGGQARQRMVNHLAMFGITLPTGTGKKWACVAVGGGEFSCSYI